jgi:hypothetical protein
VSGFGWVQREGSPIAEVGPGDLFQEIARQKQMKIHLVDRETQYKVYADPDLLPCVRV